MGVIQERGSQQEVGGVHLMGWGGMGRHGAGWGGLLGIPGGHAPAGIKQ